MRFVFGQALDDTRLIDIEEREMGVAFPESYKRIVREHDGIRFLNPQTYEEEVVACNQLIPFQENENGSMTMAEANREVIPFLPLGIVVFGIEAGGYLFGFDYRRPILGETEVPVVLLHEDNEPEHRIIQIAESFDDLLKRFEQSHPTGGGLEAGRPHLLQGCEGW